ncbi:hypothetical protein F6V30_03830 [Oryzomonas sagensis]|uniref:TRL-like family protein n=1 Tax=Oryzomonas sagensis TaxID=2603857 RepID=A0ABQ6TRP7_9BACT|nr:hypothetical protein [Oryzomonas sagensis]KAB0671718.1 hypothetical protein F6V30_03830 [Oryzomonas sagensis]
MKRLWILLAVVMLCAGCTSVGNLGMVTKSMGDPGALLRNGQQYKEIGPAAGEACRFFLLNVVPFGNSSFSAAVDEALEQSKGDALLNVTVSSSLYGFIPIYNIFSYTCTNVRGIAIKFEK